MVIAVVGEGLLANFVCGELSNLYKIIRQTDFTAEGLQEASLVLVINDDWGSYVDLQAEESLREVGIPWLRGVISSSEEGIVGPLVRPDRPGCSQCADNRRFVAGQSPQESMEWMDILVTPEETYREKKPSLSGLWQVAHLLIAETHKVMQGTQAHTEEHMYLINLKTLKTSLHFFLADSLCTVCGELPVDTSEAARILLESRPKISTESYRCRPIEDLKEVLIKDYLDPRTGLFNKKRMDLVSPFAGVSVNMPSFTTGDEITGGRSHSYAESELTAILEGLERSCGMAPHGKRSVICDSFNHLADQALDPVKVGLYAKEQYEQPNFMFEPFDPERPIDWVWGYSLLQERPLLVPEILGYYNSGYGGGFVQEGSNGCALGGSLEEAIFYGIMEVVERDSFLMTWYAKLPVPRIDPYSANDKELHLMVDRLKAVAGYDVHLYNMTMENGIPSIWALAKSGKANPINLVCAAGAHLDPVRAAKSAIHELASLILLLKEKFEAGRDDYLQMFYNPSLVQRMEDHVMLYCLPQSEERLSFLLDRQEPLRRFSEEFKPARPHSDLTEDLKDLVQVFLRMNLDVIVVDQTSPETLRNGLYCVKVLIPGMLPMTFGHHLTRVTGLERLYKIPTELGYAKQPLTAEQLNPHPHPFP